MRRLFLIVIPLCIIALLFSACRQATNPAEEVVGNYLTALVNKDASTLASLSCADWESDALQELESLQAVTTRLEDLDCVATSTDSNTTQVNCQGKILASYNNEDQEFDLSVRTYQVVKQGGDYLVCGYE